MVVRSPVDGVVFRAPREVGDAAAQYNSAMHFAVALSVAALFLATAAYRELARLESDKIIKREDKTIKVHRTHGR